MAGLAAPAGSREPWGRSPRRQEDGAGRREGEDEEGNRDGELEREAHRSPVLVYIMGDGLLLAAVPWPAALMENASPAALSCRTPGQPRSATSLAHVCGFQNPGACSGGLSEQH